MTNYKLYKLLEYNKGHNCSNCAHNTTDLVWKCDKKKKSEKYICELYMQDGFLKMIKEILGEKNENK